MRLITLLSNQVNQLNFDLIDSSKRMLTVRKYQTMINKRKAILEELERSAKNGDLEITRGSFNDVLLLEFGVN